MMRYDERDYDRDYYKSVKPRTKRYSYQEVRWVEFELHKQTLIDKLDACLIYCAKNDRGFIPFIIALKEYVRSIYYEHTKSYERFKTICDRLDILGLDFHIRSEPHRGYIATKRKPRRHDPSIF